jgi:hypothetical protein
LRKHARSHLAKRAKESDPLGSTDNTQVQQQAQQQAQQQVEQQQQELQQTNVPEVQQIQIQVRLLLYTFLKLSKALPG